MSKNQDLQFDLLSLRSWAFLLALTPLSFCTSIGFIAVIEALGGGAIVASVDAFVSHMVGFSTLMFLAAYLPFDARWKGYSDGLSESGYTLSRTFALSIWYIGTMLFFHLVLVEEGSRISIGVVSKEQADFCWIIAILLSLAAIVAASRRAAKVSWRDLLSGRASPNWRPKKDVTK